MSDETVTCQIQRCLNQMRTGDAGALDRLLLHVHERLQKLTRQMLRGHPAVKRWEQTEDVLQEALVRLLASLRKIQPGSVREFFGLATQVIRWQLLDLARHYYGPQGLGANHASQADHDPPEQTETPAELAEWCELHQQIEALPADEREVVDLLFYQGLTQVEAADLIGVNVRTVQRRWHSALVKLHEICKDAWPGE